MVSHGVGKLQEDRIHNESSQERENESDPEGHEAQKHEENPSQKEVQDAEHGSDHEGAPGTPNVEPRKHGRCEPNRSRKNEPRQDKRHGGYAGLGETIGEPSTREISNVRANVHFDARGFVRADQPFTETSVDWIVVGSGFGGSVAALRLAEKGYRVLVLEKGRRFAPEDFPKTNWNLRKWMWAPRLGCRGFFRISFLRHVTVLHGVGVGGGSLVYANTLASPPKSFFEAPSWAGLADWARELAPHYATARQMLGSATNPRRTRGDEVLERAVREAALDPLPDLRPGAIPTQSIPRPAVPTEVAVYFGRPGETVPDPYFGGTGPARTGCTFCGACMTGCRVGAKNTLDRNYLYLAEGLGVRIEAESEVVAVRPVEGGPGARAVPDGPRYRVEVRDGRVFTATSVVFAGGVMGTVPLLLAMRADPRGLPGLSPRVGTGIRTNSEALLGVVTPRHGDLHEGIAITSLLETDPSSHVEPVRYGEGSGFFRLLAVPHAPGRTVWARALGAARRVLRDPVRWVRAILVPDLARHTLILLYMRTLEGTLSFRLGRGRSLRSAVDDPDAAPQAFMPEATRIAEAVAERLGGVPVGLVSELVLGVPTTAHILGGAPMGATPEDGAIDTDHRLFGYEGLYVLDGSAVSANPGVNPSLTITALAERAMAKVAPSVDSEL
jgi:cholesterol oxidase